MNKRTFNLPSISTILQEPTSPPIIVINDDNEQVFTKTNSHFSLSPILSPIESNASSSPYSKAPTSPLPSPSLLSLPSSQPLPPLQGDDPPRRLRHPSISSIGSNHSTTSNTKPTFHFWNGLGINTRQYYSRSPSPNDNTPSRSPSPIPCHLESSEPILKRKRGRPPSLKEPSSLDGGWTFLTPTVWDVKGQIPPQDTIETDDTIEQCNNMKGSMAAFTSSTMDMVLQMPRKKRGRKPKTHIVGNSCFAWKDITAAKRSTKK